MPTKAVPPVIGQTLGHYRIVEKIGAGGMGEVYRANDEQLDRNVALKVLPIGALADETARKRFRKEAQALAKLSHPNIGVVHEFGTHDSVDFLVMEYIPGSTLSEKLAAGSLPEKEVAALGGQIAAALEEAHEQGIVHRDLKPGNILVTPKGQAKVLDFGLAKLLKQAGDTSATETFTETQAGAGTLPYMAPEQLRGEAADARSDIFALGNVLYEMATGQRAFRETLASRLIEAILHQPPLAPRAVNPRASPELERIILKCLEKDPENRYQSAKELVVDLRRLSAPSSVAAAEAPWHRPGWRHPAAAMGAAAGAVLLVLLAFNLRDWRVRMLGHVGPARIDSLAVLPLENLSRDPEQEYFADGMTDALINDLSKIGALRVVSRTSAMLYKNARRPLPEIARELNVDAIVEGSVERANGHVKIIVQLVNAQNDRNLWGNSYDGDLRDVLSLQGRVAQAIAGEIRVQLTPQESAALAKDRPVNLKAYEVYLRGRYLWNKRTPSDLRKAIDELKKAIDLDPTYPLAWAGLADGYSLLSDYDEQPPREAIPLAKAAAKKALELDNSLGEPRATLAYVEWAYDWNASAAETDFERALALSPNYASAHQWYGMYLCSRGRFDDGIAELERAQTLDPLSLVIEVNVGRCRYYARRYDQAVELLEPLGQREPDYWIVHAILGQTYLAMGRLDDAIHELERARTLSPGSPRNLGVLGNAYGRAGRRGNALKLAGELAGLSRKRYIPPVYSAMVYMSLGERSQAMAFLEKAYTDRSSWMVLLNAEPEFDSLRSDPRFRDLLRRIDSAVGKSGATLTDRTSRRGADVGARRMSSLDTPARRD
jgi:eukaryotic-like serine/threonine-protein kinase